MRYTPRAAPAALALALLLAAGCGGSDDAKAPQEDEQRIAGLVADTAEKCSAPAPAKELFVTPPDRAALKKYANLTFEPVGRPSISGTSATATVKVTNAEGNELGEVEWKFVKSGEQWKLESAPLP